MGLTAFARTLSGRLILFGVFPTIVAMAAIVATSARDDYEGMLRAEERLLKASADGAAAELVVHNERWGDVAAAMASAQVSGLFGQRKAGVAFAKSVASSSPLIIGAYVIYEPDADGQDVASLRTGDLPPGALDSSGRFVPYWFIDSGPGGDGQLKLKPNAEMESLEYYLAPKASFARTRTPSPTLTEPYLYEGVLMVSHTYPIVVNDRFVGITGIDRSLDLLSRIAGELGTRLGADVFVVSAGDRFVAATTDQERGFPEPDRLRFRDVSKSPYASLDDRWRTTRAGGGVFGAVDPVLRESCIYATCPVRVGGWSVIVRRTEADAMQSARAALQRSVFVGCVALLGVGALLLFMIRAVGRRVRTAADVAERIARGDLTRTIVESASGDETGVLLRSMSRMDGNLNALIASVRTAGVGLNSMAAEVAAAGGQQEASASALGAAASQIAAAVDGISVTGQELARTMESVSANAKKTAELAGEGRAGVEEMGSSMRDLERATTSIGEQLGVIHERSQTITRVVGTITAVADRTNILSINAAIEAEKAGAFGAGFRVISGEIGRLADETAAATLDIEVMVGEMQTAVTAGVAGMGRYADQVRRGVCDVASASSQFSRIIDRVNHGSEGMGRVNESMQAQAEGVRQIGEAMASLSDNAQQSLHSAREFSSVSDELRSAIAVLREVVARFKLKA